MVGGGAPKQTESDPPAWVGSRFYAPSATRAVTLPAAAGPTTGNAVTHPNGGLPRGAGQHESARGPQGNLTSTLAQTTSPKMATEDGDGVDGGDDDDEDE